MKPMESSPGSDSMLTKLVGTAAGAVTATLAAKILGRSRSTKVRRTRKATAAKRGQRSALVRKGGGRHG